jgi:tryptophan synthase beta subunit
VVDLDPGSVVVVNLSGRGEEDVAAVAAREDRAE